MAADGSIVIETNIDNAAAQKELNALTKKINGLQKTLNDLGSKRDPLAEQARQYGAELDAAKAKLEALKADQAKVRSALGPDAPPEQFIEAYGKQPAIDESVAEQQKKVDALQKEWDKIVSKVEEYDAKIKSASAELDKSKDTAGNLQEQIVKAGDGGEKMAAATKKADKSMKSFGKRLFTLARGALVFSAITAALTKLRKYLGNALKTNDEFRQSVASIKGALLTAFQPIMDVIVPALTVLLNVLAKVVWAIASFFAALGGKTLKQTAEAAKNTYDQANALEAVGGAADDASKSLASFDEINQLTDSSGGGGGADAGVIAPDFSTTGISDFEDRLNDIGITLGDIERLVLSIGAGLLAWKLSGNLGLGALTAGLTLALGNIKAIMSGEYKNTDLKSGIITAVSGALSAAGIAVLAGGGVAAFGIALPVAIAITGFITTTVTNKEQVGRQFRGLFGGVGDYLKGDVKGGDASFADAFLGYLLTDSWTNKLSKAIIGEDAWNEAIRYYENGGSVAGVVNAMKEWIGANDFNAWIDENVINPGLRNFESMGTNIPLYFKEAWKGIKDIFMGAPGWFKTYFVEPGIRNLSPIWNTIKDQFNLTWTGIQNTWRTVATWFKEKVTEPVGKAFEGMGESLGAVWDGIKLGVTGAMNKVIGAVESALNWIIDMINGLTSGINGAIETVGQIFGKDWGGIPRINHLNLPRLASGAVIPANREFLAVLGDQKSGTNIETPLSTMVDAFNQALRQNGGGNVTIRFDGDLAQLGRVLKPVIDRENKRLGVSLA